VGGDVFGVVSPVPAPLAPRHDARRLSAMTGLAERTSKEIEFVLESLLSEVRDFVILVKARRASAEAGPAIRRSGGLRAFAGAKPASA